MNTPDLVIMVFIPSTTTRVLRRAPTDDSNPTVAPKPEVGPLRSDVE